MIVCPCDLMSQSLIDRLGSYMIGSTFLKLLPTAHLHLRRDLSPETSKNTYPVQPSQTFPPKTHTTHKPSIFIRASRPPQWRHPCRPVFEAWHLGQSHAVSWQIGLKTHRIHGYDIFTYIWLIFTVYVGKYIQIYHTWILWERIRMYIYTPLKLT